MFLGVKTLNYKCSFTIDQNVTNMTKCVIILIMNYKIRKYLSLEKIIKVIMCIFDELDLR